MKRDSKKRKGSNNEREYVDHRMSFKIQKREGAPKQVRFAYYRNNLTDKSFSSQDGIWILKDSYKSHGVTVTIKIQVIGDVSNVFLLNGSGVKISGSMNGFGISVVRVSNIIPWRIHVENEYVVCDVSCQGEYSYVFRREKTKFGKGKGGGRICGGVGTTKSIEVPSSVSWAAAHPFLGGGVSPK